MPARLYSYDDARLKEIFGKNPNASAHELLKKYVAEELYPEKPKVTRTQKANRPRLINLAYKAALRLARDNGWVKPHHNAVLHASAWSQKKKEKFKKLFRGGASHTEIKNDGEFADSFKGRGDPKVVMHNLARQIGLNEEDRQARREATKKAREDEKKKREKAKPPEAKKVEPPKFEKVRFYDPPVLELPLSAWEKPGARVGALSRIDWKDKGARAGLMQLACEKIFVPAGCHYLVLNGGLLSKRETEARIDAEKKKYPVEQRRRFGKEIENNVIEEIASEVNSLLPVIKKPQPPDKQNGVEFIRWYVILSRILDCKKEHGEKLAAIFSERRPDIRFYKQGGDRTKLKGIGNEEEKRRGGQEIGWINPKTHSLPSDFASTAIDREVKREESATESYPEIWSVGGYGVSVSKPGGGEKRIGRFSLPVLHVPMAREEGEPSVALNQVGVRIFNVDQDGEGKLIQTWSLRDLVRDERRFVTGIKEGAKEIHHKIANTLKEDTTRRGLHIGELSEIIEGTSREELEQEIQFLIEPRALRRTTWPGIYQDVESGRYNFHLDWFQERLRYPWPYDKDFYEIRQLLFGCLHAGYNTTDYEYVRFRFPEIITKFNINVVELLGDITAGLKHHMMHKGQIIGNLNYTEQEVFAAELLGTVFYDAFKTRFEGILSQNPDKKPTPEELDEWVRSSLVLFLYIVGNHEAWQRENGHTPGVTFRDKLVALLNKHIGVLLESKTLFTRKLDAIIRSKIVELPELDAVYTFPPLLNVELLHPSKGRAKTTSLRAEEALEYSQAHLVNIANFHTTIEVEKWDPKIRQRIVTQAGAMTPVTFFEAGLVKRLDFGPVYVGVRWKEELDKNNGKKEARIFMSEHQFFNKPLTTEPLDKNTNINELKKKLKLLSSPV